MFSDRGFFRAKWNYFNAVMAVVNAGMFVIYGRWFNAVVTFILLGFIAHGEHQAKKIIKLRKETERIKYRTEMLREATRRTRAGQPMTEEFTYLQLETLAENYHRDVINTEEYHELVDEVMQGKMVLYGFSVKGEIT